MIKVLISLVILTGCSLIGYIKSATFKQRCTELSSMIELLQHMRTEITYKKEPLSRVFLKLSKVKDCSFGRVTGKCSALLDDNKTLRQSWQSARKELELESDLAPEDIEAIDELILGLGRSDTKGQLTLISCTEDKLRANLKKAAEINSCRGKMYKSLGIACGVVLVILLI